MLWVDLWMYEGDLLVVVGMFFLLCYDELGVIDGSVDLCELGIGLGSYFIREIYVCRVDEMIYWVLLLGKVNEGWFWRCDW